MNEQLIYDKIKVMLDRMEQKKQLQSLAKTNGIELNEMELTDDAADAVVISVIALMLAKMDNDERYRKLCDFGMQKRSLKVEIINDYKQRANMLYNKYKNGDVVLNDDTTMDDVPYDESFLYDADDDEEYFDESVKNGMPNEEFLKYVSARVHDLVPSFESGHIRGFVRGDDVYSFEIYVTINGKKKYLQDMVDNDEIDQSDVDKLYKDLRNKFKKTSNTESKQKFDWTEFPGDDESIEEGFGFTTKKNICNRVCEQIDIINPFMEELHKKIDSGEIKDPKSFQKWYRQDVKVSYGMSGGSTTYGDSYYGTSVNYEYGEPTLENYILRAKQVIRMSTRDKYVGTVFTREEHDKLERAFMLLYNLNINMSDCCGDYFNAFKEYNPNQFKSLLKKVDDDLTEWIDLSKEIYDFASSKIH